MYTMYATIVTKGTFAICFHPPCLKIYSRELLALVSGKGTEFWAPLKSPRNKGFQIGRGNRTDQHPSHIWAHQGPCP